jgi:hypothetical protein
LESFVATKKPDRAQPDSNEQSGSAGRNTRKENLGRDKDTGQDRYGQSGLGGKQSRETVGQKSYRQSGGPQSPKPDSNRGSGNAEDESEQSKERKPRPR